MAETLTCGTTAPDFTLNREDGTQVSLKSLQGSKVVLYFYPRADTPGCTQEAMDFNARRKIFEKAGAVILGVSADSIPTQKKFHDKYSLSIPLLSDETHRMLRAYGVWGEKSMYGKTFMGVSRATYLIDKKGKVAAVWPKVKVEGHAEEVLAAVKALPAR